VKRLRLAPRVERDLDRIAEAIARDSPRRAVSYIEELRVKCFQLAEMPTAYPLRPDLGANVRIAVNAPYLIIFRVLTNEVRVDRIIHGARNVRRAYRFKL
jgi:plasmid stabilization system protein ParE